MHLLAELELETTEMVVNFDTDRRGDAGTAECDGAKRPRLLDRGAAPPVNGKARATVDRPIQELRNRSEGPGLFDRAVQHVSFRSRLVDEENLSPTCRDRSSPLSRIVTICDQTRRGAILARSPTILMVAPPIP